MINNWLFSGDTHGQLVRFHYLNQEIYKPEETAIIVLGDFGANYYLDNRDIRLKRLAARLGYTFYVVRGNHEARPQSIKTMNSIYDEEVKNFVYQEEEFPNIKYLIDFNVYKINGLSTLVLGGAYSVDKAYRLAKGWQWFENEQLSAEEMNNFTETLKAKSNKPYYDLVLTHTCPLSKQPRELFLSMIDQTTVDNSMEKWMEDIFDKYFTYHIHLFGHYHADKIVDYKTIMLYEKILSLQDLNRFLETGEIPNGFYY